MARATKWTTQDSQTYRNLSAVAVPARKEQIAALLTLIAVKPEEL